ncbi:MAG: 30S ribosomal protein S18 [Rickettsiaceae bacterium]|nr:30S ribosomal protein S18 [Rickettsiaceae bacterium]
MQEQETEEKTLTRMADRNTRRVFFKRRKGCPLSVPEAPEVDYKNPALLSKFVSEGGRILPNRITNVCAKKQRQLKNAIKIARLLALLPFSSNTNSRF